MVNNGDGTFTITNRKTGVIKTVPARDLPQYGLGGANNTQGNNSQLPTINPQTFAATVPNKNPQGDLLHTVLSTGGGILGGIGGGAAGVGAGALIPGADLTGIPEAALGYSGGVAGSAAGSGAGNELANLIGGRPGGEGDMDQVKLGALAHAIGIPSAKILGALFHPLTNIAERGVNPLLKASGAEINLSDILQQLEGKIGGPKYNMVQPEAKAALGDLGPRLEQASGAYQKIPEQHLPGGNMAPMNPQTYLSPYNADLAKRSVGGLVDWTKQGVEGTYNNVARDLYSLLKGDINHAVPGVGPLNAISSLGRSLEPGFYGGLAGLATGNPLLALGAGLGTELGGRSFAKGLVKPATSAVSRVTNALIPPMGDGALPQFLQALIQGGRNLFNNQ